MYSVIGNDYSISLKWTNKKKRAPDFDLKITPY